MANKYPWPEIKAAYVEGIQKDGNIYYPTLKELSEKYGCGFGYIQQKAASEEWNSYKKILRRKIAEKAEEKKIESLASEIAVFDTDTYKLARAMQKHIAENLNQKDKNNKLKILKPSDILKLSNSLIMVQRAGHLALGEDLGEDMSKKRADLVELEIIKK